MCAARAPSTVRTATTPLYDHDGLDDLSGSLGNDSIDVQDGASGDTANGGLGTDSCLADGGDTTISC